MDWLDLGVAALAGGLSGALVLVFSAARPRLRIGRVVVYEQHTHEFGHVGPGGLWQCEICPVTKPRGT